MIIKIKNNLGSIEIIEKAKTLAKTNTSGAEKGRIKTSEKS